MSHLGGISVFAQKKMCEYQRSSEHVVTRRGSTGRSTVLYRCTIDVQTMYRPLRDAPASPRALRGPIGTDGPPADRRRHGRTPFNRQLPSLDGPQLLLAQPRLLVFFIRGLTSMINSSLLISQPLHTTPCSIMKTSRLNTHCWSQVSL